MDLLLLGGTAWLGRHIGSEAVARGHSVTALARGVSGDVPEGVTLIRADRDEPDALVAVAGKRWDAVVDLSMQPGQVRRAVAALGDQSGSFLFVSSGSVYAGKSVRGEDEAAELLPPLAADVMESMETYGEAKVACEQHVVEGFGADRSVIVRAGLIGGPGDGSTRTGYWPLRFHRAGSGEVLIPDVPDDATQVIDVRDLAAWIVLAAETGIHGIFNATGEVTPFHEHLETARRVAHHTGKVAPVDPQWLLDHGVNHWAGEKSLPHWLPADFGGFSARDSSAARAAGLVNRPLADTLKDTLEWELSRPADALRRSGLADEEEAGLLSEWSAVRPAQREPG